MTGRGAVFFDRDGTLIETLVTEGRPVARNNADEVVFLPGVLELCRDLSEAGVHLFLVTNQPDVTRGKVSRSEVDLINEIVKTTCFITDVEMCIHDDIDGCPCRKPRPGMILSLAARHNTDLARSVVVGDRWRDVESGANAGCQTIFINHGYQEHMSATPTYEVQSIKDAGLLLRKHFNSNPAGGTP